MAPILNLDPHARPPDSIKNLYKKYQKTKAGDLASDPDLLDLQAGSREEDKLTIVGQLSRESLSEIFDVFESSTGLREDPSTLLKRNLDAVPIYEHSAIPGLRILPGLLPPSTQVALLSRLVHRDVSDPAHQSNAHLHYEMNYPSGGSSFFSLSPSSDFSLSPKDPSVHRPLNVSQFLNKKLRWITLGGQYDWTNKVYPQTAPPRFPPDIANLLRGLFPEMQSEAAIVNFYSPGDTLSLHRDVAEECSRGLVSISIGCDGIFILGLENNHVTEPGGCTALAIRLRSGDAVYMDGPSRFAWHGVPQIVSGTCPDWLKDWPGLDGEYDQWKGWMGSKRINLNVRQMWD